MISQSHILGINGIIIHTLQSACICGNTTLHASAEPGGGGLHRALHGQFMYMLTTFYVFVSYPLCGFMIMISYMSSQISPLTLTIMSIERYIAVCFPFRHSSIVTMRKTVFAILSVWGVGCIDLFIQVILLLEFPFHLLPNLQMNTYCISTSLLIGPQSKIYSTWYTIILFLLSGSVITLSFIGVMLVAVSASTDKASADKARNTLLLHMFQLSLNLMATMWRPIVNSVTAQLDPVVAGVIVVLHVVFGMTPRSLSGLTYGLKDPSLKPILVIRLCCHLRVPPNTVIAQTHNLQKKTLHQTSRVSPDLVS
ncbi:hypothetical protein WMY93_007657 [Mugilogobius chulae]|uniref:G-protein coupled receptors family 1 profile domain-containing protein n=1 Tax=Mugilogobius chulae TaxID=88201 RepID=A0AAW0PIQ9_9GOBI